MQKTKPKPALTRRWSNDLKAIVTEDGEVHEYYPHAGEWVDLYPFSNVAEAQLNEMTVASMRGRNMDGASFMETMLAMLRHRVRGWTWTDNDGIPLPQPGEDPAVFLRLEPHEVAWLQGAIAGRVGMAADEAPLVSGGSSTGISPEPLALSRRTSGGSAQPAGSSAASPTKSSARGRKR